MVSYCLKLLREHPAEAGIDPGFEEIEEEVNLLYATKSCASFIEREEISREEARKTLLYKLI